MKKYRTIFFGTPQFAVPALESLIKDNRFDVVAVVTEPDQKSGRGKKIVFSPVKLTAMKYNITVLQPEKMQAISYKLKAKSFDAAVVCAYGQIIPKKILEITKYGFINIHPSLLPKYRGPSPIQTAILNGDRKTGVTIIKVDEKMDHGPILAQQGLEFPNKYQISNDQISKLNYLEISKILSKLGAELLIKILPGYLEGKIKPKAQDHKKATFTKLIRKEDGLINWNEPVEIIERRIRAYFPWPGTYTFLNKKRFKIIKAHLKTSTSGVEVGKLVLDLVQLEGKKEMSWQEFCRGYRQNLDKLTKIIYDNPCK